MSESSPILSAVWPVCCAIRSAIWRLMSSDCSACFWMKDAVPPMPADGWCIMIRVCGRA